jgi:protoporphyrinogen oxidase
LPVYEARDRPGGICSSYHVVPGGTERLLRAPSDGAAYRFEVGGGHWIFGASAATLSVLDRLTPLRRYTRRSGVYFPERDVVVPYPLQNNLRLLPPTEARRALAEIRRSSGTASRSRTLSEWLEATFGRTLCDLFFGPFHAMYTAGLWREIAPQDDYKSPIDLGLVEQGAVREAPPTGYNSTFVYPVAGLGELALRLAARVDVRYARVVAAIDLQSRTFSLADGTTVPYERLLSSLPLNAVVAMAGLDVGAADPAPSVLVLNIGAERGRRCPHEHWLYFPTSRSGFHRVGFYSNVDPSFLPVRARARNDHVSVYVERAYPEHAKPGDEEISGYTASVIEELTDLGWIGATEVVDATWVEVAYTWRRPGSRWREDALDALASGGVEQIGRYGRWVFQGIADSFAEGLEAGRRQARIAENGRQPRAPVGLSHS